MIKRAVTMGGAMNIVITQVEDGDAQQGVDEAVVKRILNPINRSIEFRIVVFIVVLNVVSKIGIRQSTTLQVSVGVNL